jgi:hypothetical protein
VGEKYTVFTQILDGAGQIVAQQDNPPVGGTVPTDSWRPGVVVRDPYRLSLPATLTPGDYQLILGLYNAAGRVQWQLPSGEVADHVSIGLTVKQ